MNMQFDISADLKRSGYPSAPDGCTIYAVGDIHGRADLLAQIHALIDNDKTSSTSEHKIEIYLGDYIDRGPDSATVISQLIDRSRRTSAIFLRGNHEQFLLDFLDGKNCWAQWRAVGSVPSCLSYGINPRILSRRVPAEAIRQSLAKNLPLEHLRFYADTGSYCSAGSYLFVHAGIRPRIKLNDQTPADLLGIRESFLDFEDNFGFIVIHGHTPVAAPDLRANRINIDTGAFVTNRLTCLRIDGEGARVLTS